MAKATAAIRSKARAQTDQAIAVLVSVMEDRSAPPEARVAAATQILNRGLGALVDPQKYAPVSKQFYVYSVHALNGGLLYIGKGCDRRHLGSARRLNGRSRVRAEFDSEKAALAFEKRLITKFKPPENIVYLQGQGNFQNGRR
jgi:hypothetical protein